MIGDESGRVRIATVVETTPLRIRLRGSAIDLPVAFSPSGATFTIGDQVFVSVYQRRVLVIGSAVAAS